MSFAYSLLFFVLTLLFQVWVYTLLFSWSWHVAFILLDWWLPGLLAWPCDSISLVLFFSAFLVWPDHCDDTALAPGSAMLYLGTEKSLFEWFHTPHLQVLHRCVSADDVPFRDGIPHLAIWLGHVFLFILVRNSCDVPVDDCDSRLWLEFAAGCCSFSALGKLCGSLTAQSVWYATRSNHLFWLSIMVHEFQDFLPDTELELVVAMPPYTYVFDLLLCTDLQYFTPAGFCPCFLCSLDHSRHVGLHLDQHGCIGCKHLDWTTLWHRLTIIAWKPRP